MAMLIAVDVFAVSRPRLPFDFHVSCRRHEPPGACSLACVDTLVACTSPASWRMVVMMIVHVRPGGWEECQQVIS